MELTNPTPTLHDRGTDKLLAAVVAAPCLDAVLKNLRRRIDAEELAGEAWRQLGRTGEDMAKQHFAKGLALANLAFAVEEGHPIAPTEFSAKVGDALLLLLASVDAEMRGGIDRETLILATFALPVLASWLEEAMSLTGHPFYRVFRDEPHPLLYRAVESWANGNLPREFADDCAAHNT